MFDFSISTVAAFGAEHQPLVVAVHGHGQDLLGVFLADHVFVELGDDFARRGDLGEELLARAAPPPFLLEDRLAEFDALAADINVAGPFDQEVRRRDSSCDKRNKTRSSWWCRRPADPC